MEEFLGRSSPWQRSDSAVCKKGRKSWRSKANSRSFVTLRREFEVAEPRRQQQRQQQRLQKMKNQGQRRLRQRLVLVMHRGGRYSKRLPGRNDVGSPSCRLLERQRIRKRRRRDCHNQRPSSQQQTLSTRRIRQLRNTAIRRSQHHGRQLYRVHALLNRRLTGILYWYSLT